MRAKRRRTEISQGSIFCVNAAAGWPAICPWERRIRRREATGRCRRREPADRAQARLAVTASDEDVLVSRAIAHGVAGLGLADALVCHRPARSGGMAARAKRRQASGRATQQGHCVRALAGSCAGRGLFAALAACIPPYELERKSRTGSAWSLREEGAHHRRGGPGIRRGGSGWRRRRAPPSPYARGRTSEGTQPSPLAVPAAGGPSRGRRRGRPRRRWEAVGIAARRGRPPGRALGLRRRPAPLR
jgi:hypothetical protein